MKNSLTQYLRQFIMLGLLLTSTLCNAQADNLPIELTFEPFSVGEKMPSDNITAIHQDHIGFLWIGTAQGLYRYNGYTIKRYRNEKEHAQLFTSNNISCIADDRSNNLWIGTDRGINKLSLITGECHQYSLTDYENSNYITNILFTREGTIWVGTKGGLYLYEPTTDSFVMYCDQRGNSKVPHCSITSLIEDHKGYIWIGTWDKGLYRYTPNTREFYELPKFNDINSAHVIYENADKELWVGTWGKGLYHIYNPHDTNSPLQFVNYMQGNCAELPSDYIYSITSDPYTGMLWIGTSKGLSFCQSNSGNVRFYTLPQTATTTHEIFGRGASYLTCDRNGRVWLNASLYGIVSATARPRRLVSHKLPHPFTNNYNISALAYDKEDNLWIGIANHGVIRVESDGTTTDMTNLLGNSQQPLGFKVNAIKQINGNYIFGTEYDGLILATEEQDVVTFNKDNTAWLRDNCIYAIHEDCEGNLMLGTWKGVSVMYNNYKGQYLTNPNIQEIINDAHIRHIIQDRKGNYWLSSKNKGLLCLYGNVHNPASLQVKVYDRTIDSSRQIMEVYRTIEDYNGHIWVCSDAGLMLYDRDSDSFTVMNDRLGIPYDIRSIETDEENRLWLSSPHAIIRLSLTKQFEVTSMRLFTRKDGLDNYSLGKSLSSASSTGRLCFAGYASYTTIEDEAFHNHTHNAKAYISDISISGTPLHEFSSRNKNDIANHLPPYCNEIILDSKYRDIGFEFSSFDYDNLSGERFTYHLEGYDKTWLYTEENDNRAQYNNLPWGRYILHLRSMNSDGSWSNDEQTLLLAIRPPIYIRWYAIIIYIVLFVGGSILFARYARHRTQSRHEIQLARMEKEKIEELNHNKLRFFTNITHDLMTPLTVILATINKLQQDSPEHNEEYKIIQNNLNRQIRLIQQILEFRKAETGNLHLQVSQGDIADFCRREIESIQPLMKKKELHLSLVCTPERISAYFDPDNLDKVIYNLLANAAKYNHSGGFVHVNLRTNDVDGTVQLTITDNGKGISSQKLEHIFQRFYEGDHRKFNTYGTGIGLSLTRDLVELHHGTISVDSIEGKGTTFTVTIPIQRSAFHEDEIDDTASIAEDKNNNGIGTSANIVGPSENSKATLLIVEDNQELIDLIYQLLVGEYNIIKAYNGKEAIEIMESNDIDLIITDVMMSVMDGMEMTLHLRRNSMYSSCPIIMLTAKRDEEARAEAYEAGADAYITKPFNISVLKARIENLLKRKRKIDEEIKEKELAGFNNLDLTNEDEEFLRKCIECVQKNLSNPNFDQQAFADEVNMSKSTLYKRLKSLTGMYTSAFIRNIRMKAACELLKAKPNMRIADLAYAVGYNEPKYFSSCFKKDFGMLPSEYAEVRTQRELSE